jgi:DNA-binding transcriptional ArsR family regulator
MTLRKNAEQIQEKILEKLKEGPLSVKKLSEGINSTWATISSHLEELKKDGEVREIISGGNLRIFIRSDYPVFYGLPLDKKKLNDCIFLLSEIIKLWHKENPGETINKTTMQKIAVEVARKNPELNIPILKFHYGKTLPTFLEPNNYQEVLIEYEITSPNNSRQMIIAIEREISTGGHVNIAWKEKRKQYETHEDMKIYLINDDLSKEFMRKDIQKEKFMDLLLEIYLNIPSTKEYEILFKIYSEFFDSVSLIFNTKEFSEENFRRELIREILDTFSAIWDFLTTEFYFRGFEEQKLFKEEFFELNSGIYQSKIETIRFNLENKLNNLSDYKNSLTILETELDEEGKKIFNVILEGANEE